MSKEHPLYSCNSSTLIDKPKECEAESSNFSSDQCDKLKRIQATIPIKDQQDFGTCVLAGMSSELNYLFKRLYPGNDYELPWTYLTILGKGEKLLSCSVSDAIDEMKDVGNNYQHAFNNIKKIEKFFITQQGRGLCVTDKKNVDLNPNDFIGAALHLEQILKYKRSDDLLGEFPIFSHYLSCEKEITQSLGVKDIKEVPFDKYYDLLNGCFAVKGLEGLNQSTCSNLNLNLANLSYLETGVTKDFDSLYETDMPILFFERYMSFFLNCRKVDGDLEKNRFIKNHHEAIKLSLSTDAGTREPLLVDHDKKERLIDECVKSGKAPVDCQLSVGKREDISNGFWDVMKKAFTNEDSFKNRPLSIAVRSTLFKNEMFNMDSSGGHLMNIIGVSECKEGKKCILISNSWGSQKVAFTKEDWEEKLKDSNFLPYKVNKLGKDWGGGVVVDASRFWVCGDEILKHLKKVYYIKTSRDMLVN